MSKSGLKRKITEQVEELLDQIGAIKDSLDEIDDDELSDLAATWCDDLVQYVETADNSVYELIEYIDNI